MNDIMSENISLNDFFLQYDHIEKTAEVNLYSIGFRFKKIGNNFSVCMPNNKNDDILTEFSKRIAAFSDKKCIPFNPIELEENVYEYLLLEDVLPIWEELVDLINNSNYFKEKINKCKTATESNLSICLFDHEEYTYYICTRQENSKIFKGKKLFMSSNDKLEDIGLDKLIILRLDIDFIIRISKSNNNGHIFILNRRMFIKAFNYYEHLKNLVKDNIFQIEEWNFLASKEIIIDKIDTKYVYMPLSKVITDAEYLDCMKRVNIHELKNRLIEKSGGKFTESDFEGDKLRVTPHNLQDVVKMISKGFKYNFFTDMAEER